MLILKKRTKSYELLLLEILNKRMELPEKDRQYYFNARKGYKGEKQFDAFAQTIQGDYLILHDLLFTINHTSFQIDTLIIGQKTIYMYEIKNHDGDYYYEADKLYKRPRLEIINPLHQLGRSESLLRQLLNEQGIKLLIEPAIVFINPQFSLYYAPMDKPFIFANHVERHLEKLNTTSSKLTDWHRSAADKLLKQHITESPFQNVPVYNYTKLQKGITCRQCDHFDMHVEHRTAICRVCGFKEPVKKAIIRAIEEFRILFPDDRITTDVIHHWAQVNRTKKSIRNILLSHLTKEGENRWTHYT